MNTIKSIAWFIASTNQYKTLLYPERINTKHYDIRRESIQNICIFKESIQNIILQCQVVLGRRQCCKSQRKSGGVKNNVEPKKKKRIVWSHFMREWSWSVVSGWVLRAVAIVSSNHYTFTKTVNLSRQQWALMWSIDVWCWWCPCRFAANVSL